MIFEIVFTTEAMGDIDKKKACKLFYTKYKSTNSHL